MGLWFTTKSGTVYALEDTENQDVMLLNGGRYKHNEIRRPMEMTSEGRPFYAFFLDTERNRSLGVAGQTLVTSPIQSLHVTPNTVRLHRDAEQVAAEMVQAESDYETSY